MRLFVLGILLSCLLAGCMESSPVVAPASPFAPTSLQAVDVLDITAFPDGLTLDVGVGWGRLDLLGSAAVTVTFVHDKLELDTPFSDGDGRTYVPGQFTVGHLDDGTSRDGMDFVWVGSEAGFSGPRRYPDMEWEPRLMAKAPEAARLVFATTVPGYQLQIQGGGPSIPWNLMPNPALRADLPTPASELGPVTPLGQAAGRQVWQHAAQPEMPVVVYADWWSSRFGLLGVAPTAHAGVVAVSVAILAEGEAQPPTRLGPTAGFGGYTGGGSTIVRAFEADAPWRARLVIEETSAGTGEHRQGMAVVTLPLALPA